MIVVVIVWAFMSLKWFSVELCACSVVYSDCLWDSDNVQ